MKNSESSSFRPSEIWVPGLETESLDTPIRQAIEAMNSKDPRQLIKELKSSVTKDLMGVVYAILKGENPDEYSTSDALVLFNPFANTATPNMLVRAEFIRQVAKFSDVRDSEGKLKPVVLLANPGPPAGSDIHLIKEEKEALRRGDLGPVARDFLKFVQSKDIGRVSLLGFSLGADLALAGSRVASESNLDVHSIAIGDPVGVQRRGSLKLGLDFFHTGPKELKKSVHATRLEPQIVAMGSGAADMALFGLSAMDPVNLRMLGALGRDRFERSIQTILDDGVVGRLVVGYGSDSKITRPEMMEPSLENLTNQYGQDAIISIKVQGGNHTWGDNLSLLAKLYMLALK